MFLLKGRVSCYMKIGSHNSVKPSGEDEFECKKCGLTGEKSDFLDFRCSGGAASRR